MSAEWRHGALGSFITFQRGVDITRATQTAGDVPVVSSGGVASYHNEAVSNGPGVVIGRKGTLGKVFYLPGPYWPHDTTLWVRDFNGNDPHFVYYFMSQLDVSWLDAGSANPTLNRNHLHPLQVRWPVISAQRAIAEVLGALDDKIEANRKFAATADELALAMTRQAINDSARAVEVGSIATFHNKRRVPLSSRERAEMRGNVPYYGANGQIDSVSTHIFDGEYVLVGEDGTVLEGDGSPVLTYICEPAWVNNHAHVLTGNKIASSLLYYLLRTARVEHAVTGAVQPKLSMRSLKSVKVAVPGDIDGVSRGVDPLNALRLRLQRESRALAALRDALLPKLMSGQLRVRQAERLVANAV